MADLFTAGQLTNFAGRPVSTDVWETIHTWVLAVIEAEIGELPATVPPGVTAVAWELGKAALPAPGGATQVTIGPYSTSYGATVAAGPLTADQRRRLHYALGGGRAFAIDTWPGTYP